MFRRRWSALPADPMFPSDMKQLGYFVNSIDEIRNISDPNMYFKYFISKNERWNDRQRFAMNQAIESLIHARLEQLGLKKTLLPARTPPTSPHVPIFVSANIAKARRIIVIFGESAQDLGVIAHRVVGGPGGVAKGSIESVVRAIQDADTWNRTAIVIANPGQLWWWPEGGRGLTLSGRFAVPMQSAVHRGREYDARLNAIPGHETVGRHVRSVFEEVLGGMVREDAKLAVVAVTDVADEVERFLDDDKNWEVWGPRMESLALLGGFYGATEGIKCEGFKTFLAERTRVWLGDPDPLDVPLANPEGTYTRPGMGCPVFSAGPEAYLAETLLIHAHPAVLKFIREVASAEDFRNPHYEIIEAPPQDEDARFWKGEQDAKNDQADGEAEGADDQKEVADGEKTGTAEAPESATGGDKGTKSDQAGGDAKAADDQKEDVSDDKTDTAEAPETGMERDEETLQPNGEKFAGTESDQADGEAEGADDQKKVASGEETDTAETPKIATETELATVQHNEEIIAAAFKESASALTEEQEI
ncbi:hypothetical protein CONLIGDRAFT_643152 [Coniochaeta ligniaria NRRL 30616]|uniref:Arb2 domain-containing protein n=1 Tax=Coniochaeta ligniaria NRRL 30616 TaxID=1408157 RepID=A0A1J7IUG8_9PEZI|nr:hypothetical protein CONLIGDRAFT_643152 [Coniochaeta ligniaria NRRL 30616]